MTGQLFNTTPEAAWSEVLTNYLQPGKQIEYAIGVVKSLQCVNAGNPPFISGHPKLDSLIVMLLAKDVRQHLAEAAEKQGDSQCDT